MIKRFVLPLAACALLTAPAVAADLTGTWSSVDGRQGARAGASGHDLGKGDTYTNGLDETWTLEISDMEGNAFHGEWCSPNKCEDVVGVVSASGTIHAVDEDGVFTINMVGDTMEVCYVEPGEAFRVADCHILGKQ